MSEEQRMIGFACAYTPLALIDASGFSHFRVLPHAGSPDNAGRLLHDNLCPHIKYILDRAVSKDVPPLTGMIFMNSCDSMRRLSDAWRKARPDIHSVLIDLPTTTNERSIRFFRDELARLSETLQLWGGTDPTADELKRSIDRNNRIVDLFAGLQGQVKKGFLRNGSVKLQAAYTKAAMESFDETAEFLASYRLDTDGPADRGVPVYVFGNVMPDPEAMQLFEDSGARIVGEDLCTGSRLFSRITADDCDLLYCIARDSLTKCPCARTMDEIKPGHIAKDILARARECGARGVIGHTVKFCDPYLERTPHIRELLKKEEIPFLQLEGDCTLRSIGQQKTRVEAFIEMLRR